MDPQRSELAKMIDHSLLHPTLTDRELREGCRIARLYDVASVCIKPYAVGLAKEALEGSGVLVGSVVGFPHGNSSVEIKTAETRDICEKGAVEVDAVVNIGKALGGDWQYVRDEIARINDTALSYSAITKVIFENDYLQEEHIVKLCEICNEVDVAFVKTSSGYGFTKQENGMYSYRGATSSHLKLMRLYANGHIGVKAAGGVRTLDDLLRVKSLGVARVGATATADILDEARNRFSSISPLQ